MMTDTVWSRLLARAAADPDAIAILQKRFGLWTSTTVADLVSRAARTADALEAEGIGEGDVVGTVLGPHESRIVIELALQLVGAVVVGIGSNTPSGTIDHILSDARPRMTVVQGQHSADTLLELMEHGSLTSIERMFYLDPAGVQDYANPAIAAFPVIDPDGAAPASLDAVVRAIDPGHPVVRSYTSGTTGLPVGVVRTHANILAAADATIAGFDLGPADRVLSFRALSDPVEQGATIYSALGSGAVLVLPESRTSVRQAMVEIAPTYLHLTQRFLEEIATDVRLRMQAARGLKRLVVRWWHNGLKAADAAGSVPSPSAVSRAMIGRPVLAKLGLDKVRWLLVSGTPASTETVRFFAALGVEVRPAYASAEAGGFALAATTREMSAEGVLHALPGVDVRVVDGELHLSGPSLATRTSDLAAGHDDGWHRTGDRAEETADGVMVTGRVSDVMHLADGRTVTTQQLASSLRASPYVREAILHEEGERTVAVLEPTPTTLGRWATAQGLRYTTARSLLALPEVADLLKRAVDLAAGRLDVTVDEIRILAAPLSVEGGTLTTAEKVIPDAALAAETIRTGSEDVSPVSGSTAGTPAP